MALSNDLISQFVKITNDRSTESKETTVYGTVTNGGKYVLLDGSEKNEDGTPKHPVIPISDKSTVEVADGNRVTVLIKNHSAIVTGNLADPSPSTGSVNKTVDTKTQSIESTIIQKLDAKYITAQQVEANYVSATTFNAKTATIDGTLNAHAGNIDTLTTDNVTIKETLNSHAATIENLDSTYAKIDRVEVLEGKIENLDADFVTAERIEAVEGAIENLDSTYAKIERVEAVEGDIDALESKTAKIDTLIFGESSGESMHANFANAVIALLGNAWIKSAMVESLDADKLAGHIILTEDLRIVSDDGHIYISNGVIQVLDDNSNVRVQLGKDASGRYSITIWDQNGNKMFDAGGITADAIKSDIIVNSMVSATADIDASKLNIDSLFNVINNDGTKTINATKVKLDEQDQSLEVAFNSMKTSVDELQDEVASQGSELTVVKDKITSKVWQQDINTTKSELQSETANLSTKYSTLEQTVNGISTTVASHATAINNKADSSTVTEVNTKVSALETNLAGFKSTVSETYATKTALASTDTKASDAKNSITNLKIGGRNLALNTTDEWQDVSISSWSGPLRHETANSVNHFTHTYEDYGVSVGDKITFSVDIKAVGKQCAIRVDYYNEADASYANIGNYIAAGASGRSTITLDIADQYIGFKVYIGSDGTVAEAIASQYKCLKIEKGNKSTDWTKAPEDIDSDISSLADRVSTAETSISHNADELALRATKTEVATAKSEAIASANSNTSDQLTNYSTTSEMNSAIEMRADSITSTVSTTYATKTALADTQGSIDTTHALAETANDGAVEAQSSIKQLSESIASLVTDGNGTSLMTQTEDGWTFSTADIQNSVNTVSESLSSLMNDVGDIDSVVDILQQSVIDLSATAEYIHIGVYEDEPCIELGESDSDFRLVITNTRILFMEGSSVPAYISNQSLHITKAVIEEEIQQGEFVWKVRQNGNMGLMWKGGA